MSYLAPLPTSTRYTGRYVKSRQTTSRSPGVYTASATDFIASFYAVLRRWQSETAFESNPRRITQHPSYAALVSNAELVLPQIVGELRTKPSYLVWVLEAAIGEKPYTADMTGDIKKMTQAWLDWASRNESRL